MEYLLRRTITNPFINRRLSHDQSGFTAVELLIAMAVFSFVLTLSTLGFIQINQMYQQAIAVQKVQDATRYMQADMTRTLRESDFMRAETTAEGEDIICSDRHRFFVSDETLYKQLIRDDEENVEGACVPDEGLTFDDAERVSDEEVAVLNFEADAFNPLDDDSGYYSAEVSFRFATANTRDLIDDDDEQCEPGEAGAQFCAVSEQSMVVTTRGSL